MRIKAEQLHQQLHSQLAPFYTIFGNEPLLVIETADLIRKCARQQGFSEHEIFTVDQHFRWSDILYAGGNLSLFGDRKIIDIRIPSGKPGREGSKTIESYCLKLPQDTVTLITLPKMDKQSQSTKWFKVIEHTGVMVPIYPVTRAQLPAWIKQRLGLQQQTVDSNSLQFIADNVEGNLLAAHHEIQKFALLYPQGSLTFEQVKNAILDVARYDVYQLSEAMAASDPNRYIRILRGLQGEGTAPPLILAALAEQIRQLIFLRKGLDRGIPPAQILKSARIWGDRQKTAISAARRIPAGRLLQGLIHAAKIDRINKGAIKGNTADIWHELLQLGLNIISRQSIVSNNQR